MESENTLECADGGRRGEKKTAIENLSLCCQDWQHHVDRESKRRWLHQMVVGREKRGKNILLAPTAQ